MRQEYLEIIIDLFNRKGTYSYSTQGKYKYRVPYFCIKVPPAEVYYLKLIKRELKLKSKIYTYKDTLGSDGYFRSGYSMLIVRNLGELKNSIIPFSIDNLENSKKDKFRAWLEKTKIDQKVPRAYSQLASIFNV